MDVNALLASKGTGVSTIRPSATTADAIARLKEEGVGALVVSQDGERIEGILSERDIVQGLATTGESMLSMSVSDLMTKPVKTCSRSDNIRDVMAQMTMSRIRHLPVEEDGKLCGIISIGDVVKNRLDELETETSVLRDFIVGRS